MKADRKYEWGLVALMFCIWGTLFLDRMSVLYIAPYIAPDLHIDREQIGQLAAVIALTWAISTLVFGMISDRFGRRRVLLPMIFLFSIMSFVSGLAQNFHQLLLARALMGVAEGPCWTVLNAIVERSSSPQTRARNIGLVVGAAALVGLAVAPVLSTQIAANYGWRLAFFVSGVPGFILGVIAFFYVREPALVDDAGLHDQPLRLADMGALLFNRNIILSCLGATGFIAWLFLQSAFGPIYMTAVMHEAPTTAGFLLGAAGVGSFILGFTGPMLANRFGRRRVVMVFAMLSFILPLALICPALYGHLYLLAAILFCTQGGQAITALIIVMIPTSSVPVRMAASAIGLVTMFGEIAGSVVAPIVAGNLIPVYGLGFPLEMAAAAMILVFVAAFFIKEAPVPVLGGLALAE
jgi:predicted MFS family arabinose efflux permease